MFLRVLARATRDRLFCVHLPQGAMTPIVLRIREYRLRRGLTQQELADMANTGRLPSQTLRLARLSAWSSNCWIRIAKALGCQPRDLIGE